MAGKRRLKEEFRKLTQRLGLLILPTAGYWLLSFILGTARWSYIGWNNLLPFIEDRKPFFGATWHFDLIPILYPFRGFKGAVMVSKSRDGEPVARLVQRWGFRTVRGSKHKGGLDAVREMIRAVRDGFSVGLVADGSQGPARRAQTGAVFVARAAQIPIIPFIIAARRKITLPTWDRLQIPLPFTRLVMYVGQPLSVPPKKSGQALETHRRNLEQALNELCAKAENHQW